MICTPEYAGAHESLAKVLAWIAEHHERESLTASTQTEG